MKTAAVLSVRSSSTKAPVIPAPGSPRKRLSFFGLMSFMEDEEDNVRASATTSLQMNDILSVPASSGFSLAVSFFRVLPSPLILLTVLRSVRARLLLRFLGSLSRTGHLRQDETPCLAFS